MTLTDILKSGSKSIGALTLGAVLYCNSNAATINSVVTGGPNEPAVKMSQSSGTEGWDFGKDADYLPADSPAVDYFSRTTISGHETLKNDVKGADSFTTYNTEIGGRELTSVVNATLVNTISNTDHVFDSKDIFLRLYNSDRSNLTIYNLKDASVSSIPLQINETTPVSYFGDYSFTPTGTALDIGNFTGNNLHVNANTNITSNSIVTDTLTIGSPGSYANSVPETSTSTLLALAGVTLAGYRLFSTRRGREYK